MMIFVTIRIMTCSRGSRPDVDPDNGEAVRVNPANDYTLPFKCWSSQLKKIVVELCIEFICVSIRKDMIECNIPYSPSLSVGSLDGDYLSRFLLSVPSRKLTEDLLPRTELCLHNPHYEFFLAIIPEFQGLPQLRVVSYHQNLPIVSTQPRKSLVHPIWN